MRAKRAPQSAFEITRISPSEELLKMCHENYEQSAAREKNYESFQDLSLRAKAATACSAS